MAGLRLYTSNRLEILAEKLADLLRTPPASPLDEEVIVVQSRGMERWVRMELARHHGICANIRFPFPNTIIHEIFSKAFKNLPEFSPYDPAIMTWKIMRLLKSCMKMPGFESIRFYLGDGIRHLKWFQLSERIADIFDQYLVFRPEMILEWEEGKGGHWQAMLWRELTRSHEKLHRAALKKVFLDMVRRRSISIRNFPQRISIFGISTLPPYHMDIFGAISELLDVNLFLMNPCKEYWADIVSDTEIKKYMKEDMKKDMSDALHIERGNSLLASMGALARDFLSMITGLECEEYESFHDVEVQNTLSCLQSDILSLRDRGGELGEKQVISDDDTSIQIHSCHSPMREMEILYDNLLSMFEKYPDLGPKDILVMTPDIEAYAPFIQAVFAIPDNDGKRIPFSIADRSVRSESKVAEAFLAILDLCGSRFTAPEVLSILECPPIQQRFHLADSDLPLIHRWVTETRVRWGIDAQHREEMDLPPFSENTWRFGLDRLLLGYAMPGKEERMFKGILPYDYVEGGDVSTLGKFVDFAESLFSHIRSLGEASALNEYSRMLIQLLDRFFQPDGQTERQIQMIRHTLNDLTRQQELSGFHEKVELEVIKAYLNRHLEKQGFGFGFITGGVTFCAMLPMRSIPFKVVCLVGMNSDAYPRQAKKLGFDLMARYPRPGDRSRRRDDRYLFLEAILSARKTLYISYVGQSALDNSQIPPSIVVSELLDCIGQGFRIPHKPITDHVITRHRLQAFSHTYFKGHDKFFSYSEDNFDAARRALEVRRPSEPFISMGLSEPSVEWKVFNLERFSRFFANPAKFLLKERLGILLEQRSGRLDETERFVIERLDKYHLEQTLVEKGVHGWDLKKFSPVIKATGQLPHGTPGECMYEISRHGVEEFVKAIQARTREKPLDFLEVNLHFAGIELTGRIPDIYPGGLTRYRYARLNAKDHLRVWFEHLFVNAFGPDNYPRQSILLGKDELWVYSPVKEGKKILGRFLEIYTQGLAKLTHFFPETSLRYTEGLIRKGKSEDEALREARNTWNGSEYSRGECQDDYYKVCFGDTDPLDHDFQELAVEIYAPLLRSREKVALKVFESYPVT